MLGNRRSPHAPPIADFYPPLRGSPVSHDAAPAPHQWDGAIMSKILPKSQPEAPVTARAPSLVSHQLSSNIPRMSSPVPAENMQRSRGVKLQGWKTAGLTSSDVIILVLGAPLSGKTTFIKKYFGDPALPVGPVHHELLPLSHEITAYLESGRALPSASSKQGLVVMIDTPGLFSWRSDDLAIVKEVAEILELNRGRHVRILYLHDISSDIGTSGCPTTRLGSKEPLIDAPNKGLVLTIPGTPSRLPQISTSVLSIGPNANSSSPGPSRNLSLRAQSPTSSPSAPRFGLIRTVFSQLSSEDVTQNPGRSSLDASITTKKTKRNSLVYKPRLTFESLRRNSAHLDGSRRGSFIATDDGTDDERGLHTLAENGDIPLTPTKSGFRSKHGHGRSSDSDTHTHTHTKPRSHLKRSSFAPSPSSSRSPSPSSSRSSSLEPGGVSTPTPVLFNPTPPTLKPGQAPLMKTPLRHPLDPVLIPDSKLEKVMDARTKSRKRRRLLDRVVGRKGTAQEKRSELPTVAVTTVSSHSSRQTADGDSKEKPGKLVKRYELHPSRNGFFFGGRVMTGGDSPWAFIMCLCLVFGIAGLWFSTTGSV
ncbi:hypothetical protein NMY22_g20151 [Coprinellus aureogranulatus]|nr:hypothetical protein NMY22_g20151 [Coprinellus aureogranulatus]